MADVRRVVMVGAGLAGLRTVQELRARGYDGALTLIGAEEHAPYDRPPLSKEVLLATVAPAGERGAAPATLPADWHALGVDLRLGVTALGVQAAAVQTSAGVLAYDALVLACGAEPVRLPGDEHALHLRTWPDAVALRERLVPGAHIVVVGAGWIGAELATAAARHGAGVTVLEAAAEPLSAVLPGAVGALTRPWWEAAGVRLLTGTRVARIEPSGVRLENDTLITADTVVVAVGVRPATGWLAGSDVTVLPVGVAVDASLQVQPGVFAVGDVAARWSPRYGVRIGGEHWDDAMHGPEVVAAGVLGDVEVYDPVPYVWSEQFGRTLQWCGHLVGSESLVLRGDPAADHGWSAVWLREGTVRAVLAVDRPHDFVQGRRLATRALAVDPEVVADATTALKLAAR